MIVKSIQYSIPKEKIIQHVPEKTKWFATVVPGDLSTYIFNEESEYYKDYQCSVFAHTKKKAGWDCMRHYEILANGCIPIFENIDALPEGTMQMFPRNELKQFYKRIDSLVNAGDQNCGEIRNFIRYLIEYTRYNLTTVSVSTQFLNICSKGKINPRILFISGDAKKCKKLDKPLNTRICYLKATVFHGLKTLLGENVQEYPSMDYMYDDFPIDTPLYGKGFSYSRLLPSHLKNKVSLKDMLVNIKQGKYDMVVYGSLKHGLCGLKEFKSLKLFPNLIVLNGYDKQNEEKYRKIFRDYHNMTMFIRELENKECHV